MNYIVYPGNKSKYTSIFHNLLNGKLNKNFIEPFGGSGAASLYFSQYVPQVYLNEYDKNIYLIHYAFKHGTHNELLSVLSDIWSFGNPKENKEDYYNARNTLNTAYDSLYKKGFYNWAISKFAINSMVRFGPNGFNQGWGKRGVSYFNYEDFYKIQECYKNIKLYNIDYEEFINKFKEGILFVDPPYVEMNSGTYSFSQNQYDNFLKIIKQWKDNVLYTDVFTTERLVSLGETWNVKMLRTNMGKGKPGDQSKKEFKAESVYYNFKITNSLW